MERADQEEVMAAGEIAFRLSRGRSSLSGPSGLCGVTEKVTIAVNRASALDRHFSRVYQWLGYPPPYPIGKRFPGASRIELAGIP